MDCGKALSLFPAFAPDRVTVDYDYEDECLEPLPNSGINIGKEPGLF